MHIYPMENCKVMATAIRPIFKQLFFFLFNKGNLNHTFNIQQFQKFKKELFIKIAKYLKQDIKLCLMQM